MKCLHCGRETANNQVFCDRCLENMERYPVKPGTAVHLPVHKAPENTRKSQHRRRRIPSMEERLLIQRRIIRWMALILVVLILALAASITVLTMLLQQHTDEQIGQNYRTVDTSTVSTGD